MSILVTGGAGYIGSHTCVELLNAGYDPIILDNFCNSKSECVKRVKEITGKDVKVYNCDIRDRAGLDKVFAENKIEAVIHFAGLKSVPESIAKPMKYYDNNIGGSVTLFEAMADAGCKKMVFSSSATVYGGENVSPLREDMPEGKPTNPYGTTNLVPYVAQVAVGKLDHVNVNGNDYDTPDGTGVRDYIHVVDLALGHIKAVEKVLGGTGCYTYNLGTGKGYSVLDVVRAYEKACGKKIKCVFAPRRPGDIATCYSDPSKAKKELGWEATRGIDEMCEDSWRWQVNNPEGY